MTEGVTSRWKLAIGGILVAALAYWLWPRSEPAAAKAPAPARTATAEPSERLVARDPRELPDAPKPLPGREPSPLDTMRSRVPESFRKPGTAMEFAKQVEWKRDPELEAAERLEYKRSRLRFRLADAAAACYDGEDAKSAAHFSYTLVVTSGRLKVENVKLIESTLGDPQLEDCMISQISQIDSPAPELPDLRQDGSSWISLHDLFVRTRADANRD